MFYRLDLASFNCVELCILAHVRLSAELAEQTIGSSHGHKRHNVPYSAIYGCIYKKKEIPHVVRADFHRVRKGEYHIQFRYLVEKWPKTPKDIKSPGILAAILTKQRQETVLECDAAFEYQESDGWKSLLELPIPITEKSEKDAPFTHIEAIRVSKRINKQIEYSIQLRRTNEGNIIHLVYLKSEWKDALSGEVPKQLLRRARQLSRALVIKKRKESRY